MRARVHCPSFRLLLSQSWRPAAADEATSIGPRGAWQTALPPTTFRKDATQARSHRRSVCGIQMSDKLVNSCAAAAPARRCEQRKHAGSRAQETNSNHAAESFIHLSAPNTLVLAHRLRGVHAQEGERVRGVRLSFLARPASRDSLSCSSTAITHTSSSLSNRDQSLSRSRSSSESPSRRLE